MRIHPHKQYELTITDDNYFSEPKGYWLTESGLDLQRITELDYDGFYVTERQANDIKLLYPNNQFIVISEPDEQ
jgi:hypothetical protein